MSRRLDQQKCSGHTSDHARHDQRNHNPPWNPQLFSVCATARGCADPQRQRVCRIRWHRRHTGKQQGRKSYETTTARYGINGSAEGSGKKKKNNVFQAQAKVLTRMGQVLPILLEYLRNIFRIRAVIPS